MRLVSTLFAFALVLMAAEAAAQPRETYAGLDSADAAEVRAAIDAAGRAADLRAVRALSDRIDAGLPPALLDRAVTVLAAAGRGPAGRALVALARHRRTEVRLKVAEGLVATRAPNARRLLVDMLDDPNVAVRTAAASALGELGATASMAQLADAAVHGNVEASAVVVSQARPGHVARILRQVTAANVADYGAMLSAFALREDLPRRTRVAVVERLAELAVPACHRLLQELVEALPEDDELGQLAAEALGEVEAAEEAAREQAAAAAEDTGEENDAADGGADQ